MGAVSQRMPTSTEGIRPGTRQKRSSLVSRMWPHRWMYLMLLPGFIYFVVFHYVPMVGYMIAFQDYSPFLGFGGSPWVGLENFRTLLTDPDLRIALENTLVFSFLQIIFAFPAPIALAILLNSILNEPIKRLLQSVLYLPHFLSWVVVIALWQQIFGGAGVVNGVLREQGWPTYSIMTDPDFFKPLIILQGIWKDVGWGTIIFLAALTKIDITLYEAAVLDGAGGWRRIRDVTLPGIRPIVFLLLILQIGTLLSTGFVQFWIQRNAVGADAAEVLDTLVYTRGIGSGDWGFATAVGLVKGVVGAVMIWAANKLAKRFGEEGVF